ncbi:hypothetical protein L9F63_017066, partial [Diploptera punctata]
MWRKGYNTPADYNDNQLYCGGRETQWNTHGGNCGECGDNYGDARPRAHENGGTYGTGLVVEKYAAGSVITTVAKLTANHKGLFYYRLCPLEYAGQLETEACFEKYPLQLLSGDFEYTVPNSNTGDFEVQLVLPQGVTCDQCVFQWTYVTGNSWGVCANGTGALGCGPQEHFRSCSDIRVYQEWNFSQNRFIAIIERNISRQVQVTSLSENYEHGMLMDPVNRSSMWRKGYKTPHNYDDDGLYCGEVMQDWERENWKCGVCGDSYSERVPRQNENKGYYGYSTYKSGSTIKAVVELTANHWGRFYFHLCPLPNKDQVETEECFKTHPVNLANGEKYYRVITHKTGNFEVELALPNDVTCEQCVLRWTYVVVNYV